MLEEPYITYTSLSLIRLTRVVRVPHHRVSLNLGVTVYLKPSNSKHKHKSL